MTDSAVYEPAPPPGPPTPTPPGPPVSRPLVEAVLVTFRDTMRKISPPWLQTGNAEKILYAIAIQIDAFGDALVAGVKLRFPGLYSYESLPLCGRERRISRGRHDTDATYTERLLRWLDDHPRRGGPYALLEQVHAHFKPNNFPVVLTYASGRRYSMAIDGTITRDDIVWFPPGDPPPEQWAQWWLYYTWPNPVGKRKWGSSNQYGDGSVWGSDLSPQDVKDLRLVPREWNAMHAIGHLMLITSLDTVPVAIG